MSQQDALPGSVDQAQHGPKETLIPLLEEQLIVTTQLKETGTVRLHKHAEQRTETIEVPLTRVQWLVDHVPINQVVAERPAIRQEGETTIYPVLEERVTIVREIVLLEEVRVTRSAVTTIEKSTHVLLRENILEEHLSADPERP